MDIKNALTLFFQSKTLITNLLGTRIYPDVAPQVPQFPYACYYGDGNEQAYHLRGTSPGTTDQFVFEIYTTSTSSRRDCKEAFRNCCDGRLTFMQSDGTNNIDFRAMRMLAVTDSYGSSPTGKELGAFQCTFTLEVTYFITVPTLP